MSERLESALIALACLFVIFAFAAFLMALVYLASTSAPAATAPPPSALQPLATILAAFIALAGGLAALAGIRMQLRHKDESELRERLNLAKSYGIVVFAQIDAYKTDLDAAGMFASFLGRGGKTDVDANWKIAAPAFLKWKTAELALIGVRGTFLATKLLIAHQKMIITFQDLWEERESEPLPPIKDMAQSMIDDVREIIDPLLEHLVVVRAAQTMDELEKVDVSDVMQ